MNRIEEWRAARVAEAHRLVADFNGRLGITLVVVEEPRLEVRATDSDFGVLLRWSREQPMDASAGRNQYGGVPVVVIPDPEPDVKEADHA